MEKFDITKTTKLDLCVSCEICESVCPTNAISMRFSYGKFIPEINETLCNRCSKCFEICPGIIRTDMTAVVAEKYDVLIANGLMPIKRWGEVDDVAEAVGALVEDRFPFSTGQRFHVDGGYHLRRL